MSRTLAALAVFPILLVFAPLAAAQVQTPFFDETIEIEPLTLSIASPGLDLTPVGNTTQLVVTGTYGEPVGGIGEDFYDRVWGIFVGGRIPLITGGPGGELQLSGTAGFDYRHWQGSNNIQVNGPRTNSVISGADTWVGEAGVVLTRFQPLESGRVWFWEIGAIGRCGGMSADRQNMPFNFNQPVVNLAQEPRDSAFLYGYRVGAGTGVILGNGMSLGVNVGFQQDFSKAVFRNTTSYDTVTLELMLRIPLGRPFVREPNPFLGLNYLIAFPDRGIFAQ